MLQPAAGHKSGPKKVRAIYMAMPYTLLEHTLEVKTSYMSANSTSTFSEPYFSKHYKMIITVYILHFTFPTVGLNLLLVILLSPAGYIRKLYTITK